MRLSEKEYNTRLANYSRYTLQLMSTFMAGREMLAKMHEITTNSDLTEEEVVAKLNELKACTSTKTEQQATNISTEV